MATVPASAWLLEPIAAVQDIARHSTGCAACGVCQKCRQKCRQSCTAGRAGQEINHRNGIEHPVNFQIETIYADSQL